MSDTFPGRVYSMMAHSDMLRYSVGCMLILTTLVLRFIQFFKIEVQGQMCLQLGCTVHQP